MCRIFLEPGMSKVDECSMPIPETQLAGESLSRPDRIRDVAGLPDIQPRSSPGFKTSNPEWDAKVLALVSKGWTSGEIAGKLGKNERQKRLIRDKVRRVLARTPEYQEAVKLQVQGAF